MGAKCKVIDTGLGTAKANMEHDATFLQELSDCPILHLYDWQLPSCTYGYFIDPAVYLSEKAFDYLDLYKRPTGGGVTFHVTDWAFSLLIPACHSAYSLNPLDNYFYVNQLIIKLLSEFLGSRKNFTLLPVEVKPVDRISGNFCMAKPTKYDVMLEGKKVGGGAQRRTSKGFLHQGTISLMLPEREFLESVLLPDTCVYESMINNTYPLLPEGSSTKDLADAREALKQIFIQMAFLELHNSGTWI